MPNLDNNMYRLITAHVLPIMHLPTEEIEVLRPVERCMKLAISVLWRDLKEFRPKVIVFCWVFFICLCVHVLRNRIHFSSQMNLSEKNIEREMRSHQDTDGSLRSDHGAEEL